MARSVSGTHIFINPDNEKLGNSQRLISGKFGRSPVDTVIALSPLQKRQVCQIVGCAEKFIELFGCGNGKKASVRTQIFHSYD